MKLRALVAKADGVPDRNGDAFALGSIKSGVVVPVTQEFDPSLPPLGQATIVVQGTDVYAEMDIDDPSTLIDRTPALGGRTIEGYEFKPSDDRTVIKFDVLEVSICLHGNTDQRIPTLAAAIKEQDR